MACKHVDAAGIDLPRYFYKADADYHQSFVLQPLHNLCIERTVHNVSTPLYSSTFVSHMSAGPNVSRMTLLG